MVSLKVELWLLMTGVEVGVFVALQTWGFVVVCQLMLAFKSPEVSFWP